MLEVASSSVCPGCSHFAYKDYENQMKIWNNLKNELVPDHPDQYWDLIDDHMRMNVRELNDVSHRTRCGLENEKPVRSDSGYTCVECIQRSAFHTNPPNRLDIRESLIFTTQTPTGEHIKAIFYRDAKQLYFDYIFSVNKRGHDEEKCIQRVVTKILYDGSVQGGQCSFLPVSMPIRSTVDWKSGAFFEYWPCDNKVLKDLHGFAGSLIAFKYQPEQYPESRLKITSKETGNVVLFFIKADRLFFSFYSNDGKLPKYTNKIVENVSCRGNKNRQCSFRIFNTVADDQVLVSEECSYANMIKVKELSSYSTGLKGRQ